tara:strand:- start:1443 stop:2138 length:696 start_codon:yes stop_codon:yes gene_type:complete
MTEKLKQRYMDFYKYRPNTETIILPNGKKAPKGEVKNYGSALYPLFKKATNNRTFDQRLNMIGKTVLDVGCGSGQFCFDAVTKFGAKKAYGIDIASVELGLTESCRHKDIEFFSGDCVPIPLKDNSVDIVTSFLVLEHVSRQEILQVLCEMDRVCREGWILSISHIPTSHPTNPNREVVETRRWWMNEISNYMSNIVTVDIPSDNHKWGVGDNSGYSRFICTSKKFESKND